LYLRGVVEGGRERGRGKEKEDEGGRWSGGVGWKEGLRGIEEEMGRRRTDAFLLGKRHHVSQKKKQSICIAKTAQRHELRRDSALQT